MMHGNVLSTSRVFCLHCTSVSCRDFARTRALATGEIQCTFRQVASRQQATRPRRNASHARQRPGVRERERYVLERAFCCDHVFDGSRVPISSSDPDQNQILASSCRRHVQVRLPERNKRHFVFCVVDQQCDLESVVQAVHCSMSDRV